ncbi:diguanylate cyclase [Siccirubricoccus sp. KC 17139]|uniref:diguanylate cyclase n=1 Tax=Siccirubricoccus soli TaxID=2899147 RepID=A0ABT1D7N8_9PROT|nr:diguanylate cyclase [Siccirubricoccus soli]MCO6417951.1 diguanylate cyclase [Siccirubricoccus soli]MCP2684086.1 diguanylate cyclase [Siccirubricoccus soli]
MKNEFLGTVPNAPRQDDYAMMVLLVDDQVMVGEAVRRLLAGEPNLDFHFCPDPAKAVEVAKSVRPTVILQDLVMPGVTGLDLVREYRADPATRDIPVIMLSMREEAATKSDAFTAGANDYLVKLPDRLELVARLRYHSRAYLNQLQRDEAYAALRQSQQDLLKANLELQRLTRVDGLTGLSNRRYFDEYLAAEWFRAARLGSSIAVLMIDVDEFKRYNDSHGHLAGDEVLKLVAQTLQRHCRQSTDLAARFGGEEFAVVLTDVPRERVEQLAWTLCHGMEEQRIPHRASRVSEHVTVSIGGALAFPAAGSSPLLLIDAADKALYEAKAAGKNRAVVAMGGGR